MKILRSVGDLREATKGAKKAGQSIGFVPTMGALHTGHGALVSRARGENDVVVLSIFVNPTQFNDPMDLQAYPKELAKDHALCQRWGVDFVFRPYVDEMYPDNFRFRVIENELSQKFCGQFRAGHFEGMLTVVLKLLQMVGATRAYFGEKDFQQLELVRQMVKAFFLDTEIIPCPTERDSRGLALSSRNARLTKQERIYAAHLAQQLSLPQSLEACIENLKQLGFEVEYVEDFLERRLAAVRYKNVRLIDNVLRSDCASVGAHDFKDAAATLTPAIFSSGSKNARDCRVGSANITAPVCSSDSIFQNQISKKELSNDSCT